MKTVFQALLSVAVAAAMIGFAATQARADRVAFSGGCFGAACVPSTLTMSGIPLSFTGARLTVDARSTTVADLGPRVSATRGASFSVASGNLTAESASLPSTKMRAGIVPKIVGGNIATTPEPTTLLLLGTGLVGTAAVFRRRLRAKRSNSK